MNAVTTKISALAPYVKQAFEESIAIKQLVLAPHYLETIVSMAEKISLAITQGGKLLLCGNGGSAADAQHLAGELLVRLRPQINRQAIPAMSLATDTTTITACANDYGF